MTRASLEPGVAFLSGDVLVAQLDVAQPPVLSEVEGPSAGNGRPHRAAPGDWR